MILYFRGCARQCDLRLSSEWNLVPDSSSISFANRQLRLGLIRGLILPTTVRCFPRNSCTCSCKLQVKEFSPVAVESLKVFAEMSLKIECKM